LENLYEIITTLTKYRAIAFRIWVKQMLHIVEVNNTSSDF
jgi:hypothetical protein